MPAILGEDAGYLSPVPAPGNVLGWESVGAGEFSHLICLYRDDFGRYLLRNVIAHVETPDEIVYDNLQPVDDDTARHIYAGFQDIGNEFDPA